MVEYISVMILLLMALPKLKFNKAAAPQTLSISDSTAIRGILCIIIFLNHISGWFVDYGMIFYVFNHTGHLAVAVFFFLSGYGLQKKYGESEVSFSVLLKRIIKLMLPYWICEAIYSIVSVFADIDIKQTVTLKNVLLNAVLHGEIVENSWFVGAIFVLYILWFFTKKIGGRYYIPLLTALMIVLAFFVGWWTSFFAFPVGLIIAGSESKLQQKKTVTKILGFVIIFVLFSVSSLAKLYGLKISSETIMNLSDMLATVFFPFVIYFIVLYIKPDNIILSFMGRIAYEVYLVHGLAIRISYSLFTTDKSVVFFVFALILTIILAYLINIISNLFLNSKLFSKNKNF